MSSSCSDSSSNCTPAVVLVDFLKYVLPIVKHKRFHLIIHNLHIQHIPSFTRFIWRSCQVWRPHREELINYIFALWGPLCFVYDYHFPHLFPLVGILGSGSHGNQNWINTVIECLRPAKERKHKGISGLWKWALLPSDCELIGATAWLGIQVGLHDECLFHGIN